MRRLSRISPVLRVALVLGVVLLVATAEPAHAQMEQLNNTITNLLNIATGIGLMACAFFLCVSGYYYMSSGGNPSNIERSKSAAFNAAIGFALVLSARVIANIIESAIAR